MSHFTKCDLKLKNRDSLEKAIADLELPCNTAQQGQSVTVRGWRGQTLEATMAVDMGTYDVGVVRNDDDTYDLVADWWGVETTKGVTEQEFKEKLSQRYAYHQVMSACAAQGYDVQTETSEEDGSIRLVARKWVSD
jgi:hypothetical protein